MKRLLSLIPVLLLLVLSACGNGDVANDTITGTAGSNAVPSEQGGPEAPPRHKYVGNYEQEPVYQKLMEIESCTNPDTLSQRLSELYGEEFTYIKMTHKSTADPSQNEYAGYEEPYADFICASMTLYDSSSPLQKVPLGSDTYAFFKSYSEEPSFIMDCDATYLVSKYELKQFDDGTHAHSITSWVMSDLFMCLHGFIDADAEQKDSFCGAVQSMDCYLELENLLSNELNGAAG